MATLTNTLNSNWVSAWRGGSVSIAPTVNNNNLFSCGSNKLTYTGRNVNLDTGFHIPPQEREKQLLILLTSLISILIKSGIISERDFNKSIQNCSNYIKTIDSPDSNNEEAVLKEVVFSQVLKLPDIIQTQVKKSLGKD